MTTQIETAGCASDETLARLWARDLSEREEQSLRSHLAACPACADRARRLAALNDTWVERLRSVGAPPAGVARTPTALSGDAVPGYQIEGEIARGGQGVVYRAVQLATRRVAAVKILRDGALASDAARRRFQREIELIAELRHPNLLTVYDAGMTRDGRAYFAMEFIEGQWLRRWIEANATMGDAASAREFMRELLRVFVRICGAVNYAHQRGVIHRDLKPSNVLIDSGGEPRVVDFGLARWIAAEQGADLTAPEQVAGTLAYMSPEQSRGLPDSVDVRSDVYSLGVMLYEALTQTYPYPIEPDTIATLRHIAETAPTPPRRRPGGKLVDDELETIVLKALAKERERRYQSAGELARDLEHYLAGEPIEAKRDRAGYVLRKLLQRHRLPVGLSAAFLVTVIGLAAALAVMYARQNHLREVAEARYQQTRALARSFIFDFDPMIRRLPGAAAARQLVVEKGLEYLSILARDAPNDPALQREIASGYLSIGDIQADTTSSNLGQAREARVSYLEAIRLLEALGAEAATSDPDLSTMLVTARLRLVDVLLGKGEADTAMKLCQSAYALADDVLRRSGEKARFLDSRIDALERLGNCKVACGDRAGGESIFDQVLEASQALAARRPDSLDQQRDLAVAYTKVAHSRYAAGDRAGALDLYRRYVAITDRLLAAAPDDVLSLRDSGVGYQWIGILELESGRAQEAIAPFNKSRELLERLWTADTANASAGISLAATLTRLVEAEIALNQFDAAERSSLRNMEVSRALAERSPDSPGVRRQYGVSLYKMFELQKSRDGLAATDFERGGANADACAWLEKCHAWFVDLKQAGQLDASDAEVPEILQKELDACRQTLEES